MSRLHNSNKFLTQFFCVVDLFNIKCGYRVQFKKKFKSILSASALTTVITSTGVIEPVQTGQAAKDYLAKSVNPTLLKGLTELCKQKPIDPVVSHIYTFFIYDIDWCLTP